ncbi:hypothetical protein V8E36_009839 [Tilletia maclaganii]
MPNRNQTTPMARPPSPRGSGALPTHNASAGVTFGGGGMDGTYEAERMSHTGYHADNNGAGFWASGRAIAPSRVGFVDNPAALWTTFGRLQQPTPGNGTPMPPYVHPTGVFEHQWTNGSMPAPALAGINAQGTSFGQNAAPGSSTSGPGTHAVTRPAQKRAGDNTQTQGPSKRGRPASTGAQASIFAGIEEEDDDFTSSEEEEEDEEDEEEEVDLDKEDVWDDEEDSDRGGNGSASTKKAALKKRNLQMPNSTVIRCSADAKAELYQKKYDLFQWIEEFSEQNKVTTSFVRRKLGFSTTVGRARSASARWQRYYAKTKPNPNPGESLKESI